ncbi:hypothetical protein FHR70_000761 [Microvirga lupini]|uniref:Uncharacterized protein n=1 Tax=Microvirga lupini TaxID=420324 RepID=A0A7W4YVB8_9HYPH|nr:hypothetical protein [Microvirga lupini]MBB3017721.1 hypothetical protein [Microvirga lupini]
MSDTPNERIEASLVRLESDTSTLNNIVHGPEGETVPTESGEVPTVHELFRQIGEHVGAVTTAAAASAEQARVSAVSAAESANVAANQVNVATAAAEAAERSAQAAEQSVAAATGQVTAAAESAQQARASASTAAQVANQAQQAAQNASQKADTAGQAAATADQKATAAGQAAAAANQKASSVVANDGAGMVPFDSSISYPAGSVGKALAAATQASSSVDRIVSSLGELKSLTGARAAILNGVVYNLDEEDDSSAESFPYLVVSNDGKRWKWEVPSVITARMFGAVPGISADNTAAIQKAIDYCLSFTPAKSLVISERYRIAATLMVDNPVDASAGEFYLIGVNGGGFYVNTAITLFSSRLPYGSFGALKSPSSEYLHFDKIRFEASDRALNAYVVSDKFLRLTFESCQWRNIKCLQSADYIQSWAFTGKNLMRRHQGIFLNATYGYDVNIQDVNFEISGSGFIFDQFVNVIRMSGLYENSDGPFFRGGANTGTFEKLYFEMNGSPELDITGGATIRISAHFHLDQSQVIPANDHWPIVLGQYVDAVTIDGCTSNGNICNNSAAPAFSVRRGTNTAGHLEFRTNPLVDTTMAAAGTNQATATPITREYCLVLSGGAGNGVRLPSADTKARYSPITVQNRTASTITVYPAPNERILGNGTNAGMPLTSGATARFVWQNGDAWANF